MDSLASSLMVGITLYRNQPSIKNKVQAQFGYALVAAIAAIESVAALFFFALALPLTLLNFSF